MTQPGDPQLSGWRCHVLEGDPAGALALGAAAGRRVVPLALSTIRLAGRANTAHARRDPLNHEDAFAVCGI